MLIGLLGKMENLGAYYFSGLVLVLVLFIKQQINIKERDKKACFNAFLDNNYVGLVIFLALVLSYL